MSAVLQTTHLKKSFGQVHAVTDVSLTVQPGEVFGFLGPNGAGKTTTIGMILGLLYPTAGEIFLFGEPVTPSHTAMLKRVGALFGAQATLVPYLSARAHLQMIARLYGNVDKKRIDDVLEQVGLTGAAERKAEQFSTGMKQRLGLAMALVHRPDLLILDEPTNGMDPEGMREVRNLIRTLADEGTTVFLSSHLLHEIEQVADRVAILSQGKILAQDRVEALLAGSTVVRVRVANSEQAIASLQRLPGVKSVEAQGTHIDISGLASEVIAAHLLINDGIIPSEITTTQNDLEDVFLQLTHQAA